MSKITVTTISGLTSGSDANKVKIESGDTLEVVTNATVGGTLGVTGNSTVGGTLVNTGLITASAGVAIGGTGSGNTLDDYEEGTFTPSVTFGGASAGITYSSSRRLGTYTKIGNCVQYFLHVEMSSKGSSTGGMNITGLPFTAVGSQHYIPGSVFIQQMASLGGNAPPIFRVLTGSTSLDVYQVASSNYSGINNTHCTNTTGVQVSGKYYTS